LDRVSSREQRRREQRSVDEGIVRIDRDGGCTDAAETPKHLNIASLNAAKSGNEAFALTGKAFYLRAPDGIGRSRLAQRVERLLGVDATGRNWRTVTSVLAMAGELK
jgi:uncharacterized protein (DUF1697 family)